MGKGHAIDIMCLSRSISKTFSIPSYKSYFKWIVQIERDFGVAGAWKWSHLWSLKPVSVWHWPLVFLQPSSPNSLDVWPAQSPLSGMLSLISYNPHLENLCSLIGQPLFYTAPLSKRGQPQGHRARCVEASIVQIWKTRPVPGHA